MGILIDRLNNIADRLDKRDQSGQSGPNEFKRYSFSTNCIDSVEPLARNPHGLNKAIRKCVYDLFTLRELAEQTPAGGGDKPPMDPKRLLAVKGKLRVLA